MNLTRDDDSLLRFFQRPESAECYDAPDWRDLLSRARIAGLLPRVRSCLVEHQLLDGIPEKARLALEEALMQVRFNQSSLRFEVNRVQKALSGLDPAVVLLKGGAYLLAHLPPADKRLVSDLDIMVERSKLDTVEKALRAAGWRMAGVSEYDERYYRTWMHEIPPMWHPDRLFTLDLHHAIKPLTSRRQPNTEAIFQAATAIEDTGLKALDPADMVLHSGVHLFDEEIGFGLRDLLDVHDLLSHFGKEPGFWERLGERARLHNLERTLFYVLRYREKLLAIPVPQSLQQVYIDGAPNPVLRVLMDALFVSALAPPRLGQRQLGRAIALWLLYVRSHWLRMPPGLLARHLCRKALERRGRKLRPQPTA